MSRFALLALSVSIALADTRASLVTRQVSVEGGAIVLPTYVATVTDMQIVSVDHVNYVGRAVVNGRTIRITGDPQITISQDCKLWVVLRYNQQSQPPPPTPVVKFFRRLLRLF